MRGSILTLAFCLLTGAALALSVGLFDRATGPDVISSGLICEFQEVCDAGQCQAALSAPFRIDPGPTAQTLRVAAGDTDVVARMDFSPAGLLIPLSGTAGESIDLVLANDLSFSYALNVPGTDGTPEQTAHGSCIKANAQ